MAMSFALFLLLPASAAMDLTRPPAPTGAVTTYNAIVATEETLGLKNLARPAVFIGDGAKNPIIGSASSGPIA
jgi:hypothetical protein